MSSADSLAVILERTRQNLLDLSLRNRLINTPRGAGRSKRLEIVDERSDEIFRLIVRESKSMSFLPGTEDEAFEDASDGKPTSDEVSGTEIRLSQPDDDSSAGPAARHRDTQLQTRLSSTNLQARLLGLYYDARTFEEEQGVSILYLALGFLEWYETNASDKPRFAPLILVPVDLSRMSASSRFKLRFRDDDLATNLSLQAKLRQEFGIELPELGEAEDLQPSTYFARIEVAIEGKTRWKIHRDDIVLWFFSFAKYLMYRDLDPETWPGHSPLNDNPCLRQLLAEGFESSPPICDDHEPIDPVIPPDKMIHVTDADSSQAVVIEEVRRGRNLVVQGPPGTGKSQTITNIIATAVHAGKKVLFIAEKMAALEVVKTRLDRLGLGAVCLELHSHKSNKKATLEELNRTIDLRRPRFLGAANNIDQLTKARERLNRHAALMNTPLERADVTPYQIIGHLVGSVHDNTIPLLLDNPEQWLRTDFEERGRRLNELENYVQELGDIAGHAWRGVRRSTPILPTELQQLLRSIREHSIRLAELEREAAVLSESLQVASATVPSRQSVKQLTRLGQLVCDRPPMDRAAMVDPIWDIHPARIQRLVERGHRLAASKRFVDSLVTDLAWRTDVNEARRSLAAHGRCWCWFLYRGYWRAIETLRGILKGPMPPGLDGRLQLLDELIAGQAALSELRETGDAVGRPAFGDRWNGEDSDFDALQKIIQWEQRGREAQLGHPFRAVAAQLADTRPVIASVATLEERASKIDFGWQPIIQSLQLEMKTAFSPGELEEISFAEIKARCAAWDAESQGLSAWIGYQIRRTASEQDGLGHLIEAVEQGSLSSSQLVARFRHAYYESLLKRLLASEPELAAFHGPSHEQQIQHFRELDVERMDVARREVALSHFAGIPRESSLGEMAVVRGEIAKKRMHRPIRQLLREAGRAVQSIKPVFMMSPISVAQFLEPGVLEFDLLVMDEASQVTPEDALGAMARAKQIVVVGDSKQLPPSRFFSKLLDEGDPDDDVDLINTSNLDSVLGLCLARGLPQRMLRWHYRSRHHSLIAVSNQEFYDNQLCVIPSPTAPGEGSGLQFRFIADGRFDRGGTATNRREAAAIADAVIEHARQRPTKSLGVAAFSVAQRDAIRNELELRLRKNSGLDEFFSTGRHESFFVKNLENVQGDERDFIFISVGYAPDSSGNLTMNFGPLGTDGGERRLNVLISRAKECCVVFSSINGDQIDLNRARSRGAAALKTFLKFAETGRSVGVSQRQVASVDANEASMIFDSQNSEFEQHVSRALNNAGLIVHHRVGTKGLAIDLGITDPEHPDRFLLGIECDGATYHSSRWARDRDRLRDAVLRDRGWLLHRIWSTDWFHRPDEQLNKVLNAVEQARTNLEAHFSEAIPSATAPTQSPEEIAREDETCLIDNNEKQAPPYIEADFSVPFETPIPDMPADQLQQFVAEIVNIEGPVHRSEVSRRLLTLWRQQRLGPAIARKIDEAMDAAIQSGRLEQDQGEFLSPVDMTDIRVRSRRDVISPGLRKPELISTREIQAAIMPLVTDHVGITHDELCSTIAKLLGLKLVSPRLRSMIEESLAQLIERQQVNDREGKLYADNRKSNGKS